MVMQELAGKVAIVSGATRKRGLGRAIALTLAKMGADLVVTGTGKPSSEFPPDEQQEGWRGLPDIVDEIAHLGVRSHAVFMDATKTEDVQRLVEESVTVMGRIDILINNATYPRGADRVPIMDLDDTLWRRIIDINLTGSMLCAKYVARQMVAQGQGGAIVGVSSVAALRGAGRAAAYSASKAGMHALNASLAMELAPHGVTVNVVAPGFIDTARIDELREGNRWEERLRTIPIKRAGSAGEVAELVGYLCGPSARWISGQVFVIDGGENRRVT